MAGTSGTSSDGRYMRNVNHPSGTWSCLVCWALVMVGSRTTHTRWHSTQVTGGTAGTVSPGFGA